jgi:hypothetical protein
MARWALGAVPAPGCGGRPGELGTARLRARVAGARGAAVLVAKQPLE